MSKTNRFASGIGFVALLVCMGCGGTQQGSGPATVTVTASPTSAPSPTTAAPKTETSAQSTAPASPETESPAPTSSPASPAPPEKDDCLVAKDLTDCILTPAATGSQWEVLLKNPADYIGLRTVMFFQISTDKTDFDGITGQPGREGFWGYASWSDYCEDWLQGWPDDVVVAAFGDDRTFTRQLVGGDQIIVRGTFVGAGEVGFDEAPYFEVEDWAMVPTFCEDQ